MNNIAITGASGYIGRNLSEHLTKKSFFIVPFVWRNSTCTAENQISLELNSNTNWIPHLKDVDCIVHLAALVHSRNGDESKFFEINAASTLRLAKQAIQSGVKRFIFISSISVNGVESEDIIFKSTDRVNPISFYAQSKSMAEIGLVNLSQKYPKFELVIIRPSMVYGIAAPGNFSKIVNWARFIMPFPRLPRKNLRQFLAIQNLVELISICISHPMAKGKIFLAADPIAYSTYDFIKFACYYSGKKFWEVPIDTNFTKLILLLLGKHSILNSLYSSLRVDISDAYNIIGWRPSDIIGDFMRNKNN
jgi:nucleoside-diphosphate-sugar epimerase